MKRSLLLLIVPAVLVACAVSAPPLNAPVALTATIGTFPFVADTTAVGGYFVNFNPSAGVVVISASNNNAQASYELGMTVPVAAPAVGTYFIQCGSPSYVFTPTASYATDCYANGQIEITSIDTLNHRISGRFAFRARLGQTDSLIQVSNGRFASRYN